MTRKNVEDLIYERRLINEEILVNAKSRILSVPYKKIKIEEIEEELLKLIPEETVRNYKVIPISRSADTVIVGMLYPDDAKALDALKFIAKQLRINLGVYLITRSEWEEMLRRYSPYRGKLTPR